MFLYRQNMRQIGICTPSCPLGYYGVRHQYYSTCNRCHIDHCQACFSRHYCTRCRDPYMAFQGQCIEQCPEGLYYANYSRDCQERVDCIPGPWTQWSTCSRNGRTCGYKWGAQTRTRQILQPNSPNGQECPARSRTQRCRLANRWCSDEECNRRKRHRNRLRKYKRRRGRKRKRGRRKNGRRRRFRKKRKRSRRGRRRERLKRKRKTRHRRLCRDRSCRSRNKRRRKNGCSSRRRSRG
ncbi:R-spondin-2-like [Babylonia areolata]|uniref:R-spondin-2-like n=1 Tax=Babylonia areolata TaxID=304850 RepID=UPI003FD4445C